MFYVYILSSLKKNRIYVGYSTDLRARYREHLAGKVSSTRGYLPWKLVYYEAYLNKHDATSREKELKLHAAKNRRVERIKKSLSEANDKIVMPG